MLCVTESMVVGVYNVTVVVAGVASVTAAAVSAVCPSGYYGVSGEVCEPCPVGAVCNGYGSEPEATPGYFRIARAEFANCLPAEACMGGADSVCAELYTGVRCAECRQGAYRYKAGCTACPNTAWLLFLLFSVSLVTLVAMSVYLSKKRINLAALGIGVVRVCLG